MDNTIWSYCGTCQTLTEHQIGKRVYYNQYFYGNKLICLNCKKKPMIKMGRLFKTKLKYR